MLSSVPLGVTRSGMSTTFQPDLQVQRRKSPWGIPEKEKDPSSSVIARNAREESLVSSRKTATPGRGPPSEEICPFTELRSTFGSSNVSDGSKLKQARFRSAMSTTVLGASGGLVCFKWRPGQATTEIAASARPQMVAAWRGALVACAFLFIGTGCLLWNPCHEWASSKGKAL